MPPTLSMELTRPAETIGQRLRRSIRLTRTSLGATWMLFTALEFSVAMSPLWRLTITALQTLLLPFGAWLAWRAVVARAASASPRRRSGYLVFVPVLSGLALLALVEKWWIALREDASLQLSYTSSYRVLSATLTVTGILFLFAGGRRLSRYFATFAEHPARQTALSFVGLAVLGAFLLTLPVCVREPSHVSFLNALFMATSAVCVTGLSLHGLATEYTIAGQLVLLGLVQVGGLGIMVLSASIVVLTGRKLRARSKAVLAEVLDADSIASLRGNIRRIVTFTLSIELIGAGLLYLALQPYPEIAFDYTNDHPLAGAGSIAWAALFHAVSAFCNAGFTITRDGLLPLSESYVSCSLIMVLIVLGGLGFPVLSELWAWGSQRMRGQRPLKLSLHTRSVLMINAGLIVVVALLLSGVEWNGAFVGRAWYARAFSALFQSVTLRTAGFSTVDFAFFSQAGLMLCMLCMVIGASPGGTGGGVKTTTFAVLFATLRAEMSGEDEPRLFDRRLPRSTVRRAIAVGFVALLVLTASVFLLLLLEPLAPLALAFEAVSAFGTVGLSANVTPLLSAPGKLVIIVTMLIGRVGPLTAALAAAERVERAHHHRPHERVLIG